MTHWFIPLLSLYASQRREQFIRKTLDPTAVQEQFLKTMLRHYRHTARGQSYQIGEIRSVDEFRDRLPMTQYIDYESDIDRTVAGERHLLTPDPIRFFTITSGTTGSRKWIPMTRRFQNALQRANIASLGFFLQELRTQGKSLGQSLVTNSAQVPGKTKAGIEYGLASAGSLRSSKRLAPLIFAQPYDILQISDSRTRHYVCCLGYGVAIYKAWQPTSPCCCCGLVAT
jgi:phenylacetate-coenzyme A ligase PaaK-like adenylate-forming protein